jgi:murein L,D-transpeptidase YafK
MRTVRAHIIALLAAGALSLAAGLAPSTAVADSFATSAESLPAESLSAELAPVDRVVVRKADRRMDLYRSQRVVRSFRVSLGLVPGGPKEHEGDYRTPEGRYYLTNRKADSDYFLAIQVSYPNEQDAAMARRRGLRTGGSIMVHGLPNVLKYPRQRYLQNDWTNGCIALSNDDMLEFWLLTQSNTPIEIQP